MLDGFEFKIVVPLLVAMAYVAIRVYVLAAPYRDIVFNSSKRPKFQYFAFCVLGWVAPMLLFFESARLIDLVL